MNSVGTRGALVVSRLASEPPRWARVAAHAAALTPLPSALWRFALAFGLSAGYTEAGLKRLGVDGWAGRAYLIGLSVVTEAAALLTIGLVASWGEVVPRWVPRYGGRPVRNKIVVIAAASGAVVLTLIWTPNLMWWAIDHPDLTDTGATLLGWVYLPLIAWGPLLAAVTISYARRHRPPNPSGGHAWSRRVAHAAVAIAIGRTAIESTIQRRKRALPTTDPQVRTAPVEFAARCSYGGQNTGPLTESTERTRSMTSRHAPSASTARIPLDPPRTLLYRVGEWYSRRTYGDVLDPGRAIAHNPRVLLSYVRHERSVARWNRLDPTLKALAVMTAAATVGCSWCMDFGYWEQHENGIDPAKLRDVPHWRDSEAYTDTERRVMGYAQAMTATPPAVTDEMVAGLRQDLDDAALVELTMMIAVENERSRFNSALGLTSQGFKDRCALPADG